MTDNHTKSPEKQLTSNQAQPIGLKSQKTAPAGSITSSVSSQPSSKVNKVAEPQIKKVDVAIAGVTYPIYCPVHEQEELLSAVSYINNYALDLKKDAPSLSQESLLVLCCLNLYEKIHANQRSDEDRQQQDQKSDLLLNKIMKDAQSIL